jgi:stage II sporulation protein AA (anti-sigma F factor antagonist)
MTEFSFAERRSGGVAELALSGDLDMSATFRLEPALDRLISSQEVGEVVLDLGGVEFVDSSGLGLLLATYERSREGETAMAIVGPSPEVQRVFRLAGVEGVLPLR